MSEDAATGSAEVQTRRGFDRFDALASLLPAVGAELSKKGSSVEARFRAESAWVRVDESGAFHRAIASTDRLWLRAGGPEAQVVAEEVRGLIDDGACEAVRRAGFAEAQVDSASAGAVLLFASIDSYDSGGDLYWRVQPSEGRATWRQRAEIGLSDLDGSVLAFGRTEKIIAELREFLERPYASARVTVVNKLGLHSRPSMQVVDTANRFESTVSVARTERDGMMGVADGRSIIALTTLCASQGTALLICAAGGDAQQAVDAVRAVFEGGFGEE